MSSLSRPGAAVVAGLTLGTATAGLLLAPAASAAGMPTAKAPASVVAGQEFEISGANCYGDPVKADFVPFVGLLTDAESDNPDDYAYGDEVAEDGTWRLIVHFPANTPAGEHE